MTWYDKRLDNGATVIFYVVLPTGRTVRYIVPKTPLRFSR